MLPRDDIQNQIDVVKCKPFINLNRAEFLWEKGRTHEAPYFMGW